MAEDFVIIYSNLLDVWIFRIRFKQSFSFSWLTIMDSLIITEKFYYILEGFKLFKKDLYSKPVCL